MAGRILPSRNRTWPQKAALFGGMKQTKKYFWFGISAVPEYGESSPLPALFSVFLGYLPHSSQDLQSYTAILIKTQRYIYIEHLPSLKLLSENAHDLPEGAGFLSNFSLANGTYWTFAIKHTGPIHGRNFWFMSPWMNLSRNYIPCHFHISIQKQNKTFLSNAIFLTGIISTRDHFHGMFIAQVSEGFGHQNLTFQFWVQFSWRTVLFRLNSALKQSFGNIYLV